MLASWWLAVVGLPVFMQPLPEAPDLPAAAAVAGGRVSLRQPWFRLACGDAEWAAAAVPAKTLSAPVAPGAITGIRAQRPARLATRRFIGLYSPASQRDRFYSTGGAALVDARYGLEAVRNPWTNLQ